MTPPTQDAASSEEPREWDVRFEPSGQVARVASGTTLLEAARSVGLPVASACGAGGVCARCGMRILAGSDSVEQESGNEIEIKRRNRIDPALRLSCRVQIHAPLTATATYWG